MQLGAWWGAGHAFVLLAVGLPLIASDSVMPPRLEQAAERLIGIVIMVLAVRVLLRWWRARRLAPAALTPGPRRTQAQAATIGVLHGLGGTGAVTVLFLSLLPDRGQAMLALTVFAPMTAVSMTACTGAYAWAVSCGRAAARPAAALTPLLAVFGLAFGGWFAGVL